MENNERMREKREGGGGVEQLEVVVWSLQSRPW